MRLKLKSENLVNRNMLTRLEGFDLNLTTNGKDSEEGIERMKEGIDSEVNLE